MKKNGIKNVFLSGDTRFDRVQQIANKCTPIKEVEQFKNDKKLFIAGSTWSKDEFYIRKILPLLKQENFKLILAPHHVSQKRIDEIVKKLSQYCFVF